MLDPRLRKAAALVDDASCLLVDIVDERPADATPRDLNHIDAARQFINASITHIQAAESKGLAVVIDPEETTK